MSTSPAPLPEGATELTIQKETIDLDTGDVVTVRKTGLFTPVATAQEFVSRLNNDSAVILKIMNQGLKEYERANLENSDSKWSKIDDEGNVIGEFTGTPLEGEKLEQFNKSVLQIAKQAFGYDAASAITDTAQRSEARKNAKQGALRMLLAAPQVLASLKG